METLEKAPSFFDILKKYPNLLKIFGTIPVEETKKWLAEYKYWSEFKYTKFPPNITPEIAWIKREFDILSQRINSPVYDKQKRYFSFWVSPRAQQIMYQIDRSISSTMPLQDLRDNSENGKYLMSSLIEEAANSSIIEGAATTRRQAKELIASNKTPSNKSEWMIINNFKAIKYVKTVRKEPLTLELIQKIHTIITNNTLSNPEEIGKFRESPQDDNIVIEDDAQHVLYRTPPGKEVIPRLQEIIDFINKSEEQAAPFIHPIIKSILLHFAISYIHPFTDGNGRTARALFYWYMLRNNYWLFEYLSISKLMIATHGQYNRAFLYSEYSDNDLTYFINYHLEIISKALTEFENYLHKQKVDFQTAEPLFKKWPELNFRQKDLLINALKNPTKNYVIKSHSILHDITVPTSRADFFGLVKLNLFTKVKRGKQLVFIPIESLQEVLLKRKK